MSALPPKADISDRLITVLFHPFAWHALGLGNLIRTHLGDNGMTSLDRLYIALGSGKTDPLIGLDVVLWDALAFTVQDAEA